MQFIIQTGHTGAGGGRHLVPTGQNGVSAGRSRGRLSPRGHFSLAGSIWPRSFLLRKKRDQDSASWGDTHVSGRPCQGRRGLAFGFRELALQFRARVVEAPPFFLIIIIFHPSCCCILPSLLESTPGNVVETRFVLAYISNQAEKKKNRRHINKEGFVH